MKNMKRDYKSWRYFIIIPLVFYILMEFILRLPYNEVVAEAKAHYIESTLTLIGVLLFSSVIGTGVHYWHYKRAPNETRPRNIQMIISLILLCLDYVIAKIMILVTTMPYNDFVNATGIRYLNPTLFETLVSGVLLIYFLFQSVFVFYTLLRQRKLVEARS